MIFRHHGRRHQRGSSRHDQVLCHPVRHETGLRGDAHEGRKQGISVGDALARSVGELLVDEIDGCDPVLEGLSVVVDISVLR